MIPLRDKNQSRTTPYVNYFIIGVCVLVFFYELSLDEQLGQFIDTFAVVPANVAQMARGEALLLPSAVTLLTSMFLHGGWMHLLGNMLYLYIFGDNVEDRLGHGMYGLFYLVCGAGSAIIQVLSNPGSHAPLLGASGAIAGILGAYFILFPRARILTLIPLVILFPVVEVPAFFFLGFWFVLQLIQAGLTGSAGAAGGGVAWWAHLGGFVVGAVMLLLILLTRRMRKWR
jgi:membrane associated rhomboid family serine protease